MLIYLHQSSFMVTNVTVNDDYNNELNIIKTFIMKRNMGNFDRVFRIPVAAVITVLYFTNAITETLAIVLLIVAAIFLITGFTSVCPLYSLFGINTCANKHNKTAA